MPNKIDVLARISPQMAAVLTKEDILAIAKVAKTHDLWVLTDEPYDAIVYNGIQPYSMAQVPEMQDRVMVLNSFSKSYAMTGWRIGYLVAPEPGYIKKWRSCRRGWPPVCPPSSRRRRWRP